MREINFNQMVYIAVSDRADGNMKDASPPGSFDEGVAENRRLFLAKAGIEPSDTALLRVDYSDPDFLVYRSIDSAGDYRVNPPSHAGPVSDGLATGNKRVGLMLPLGDCQGIVLYDSVRAVLMMVHSGRHNLEQDGAAAAVRFLVKDGSAPANISAWLSPSAGVVNYPVASMEDKGLEQIAREQLGAEGVTAIVSDGIDTTTDENYYSHSQGDTENRFAILAYMR